MGGVCLAGAFKSLMQAATIAEVICAPVMLGLEDTVSLQPNTSSSSYTPSASFSTVVPMVLWRKGYSMHVPFKVEYSAVFLHLG